MLNYIYNLAKSVRDKISSLGEKGQGMTEYALVLAAVAIIAAAVLFTSYGEGNKSLQDTIAGAFTTASDKIDEAQKKADTSAGDEEGD